MYYYIYKKTCTLYIYTCTCIVVRTITINEMNSLNGKYYYN